MKILLSIKPEFADKIFEGTKQFEFRKSIFKDKTVRKVVVYASSPIQKVVGEFEIEYILNTNPSTLWEETKEFAGISKEFFDAYFNNRKMAFAFKIKSVKSYKQPLCLKRDFKINTPPQSFMYLND
ncbi:MAG: ASCH domain-containing protein [Spirosomataceae bacterium]